MTDHDPLDMLGSIKPPSPHEAARQEALSRAMEEFDSPKISATAAQGQGLLARLISGANHWREIMSTKQFAGQALATLLIVPLAGIAAWSIIETQQWSLKGSTAAYVPVPASQTDTMLYANRPAAAPVQELDQLADQQMAEVETRSESVAPALLGKSAPMQRQMMNVAPGKMAAETIAPSAPGAEPFAIDEPNRDRVQRILHQPGQARCRGAGFDLLDRRRYCVLFVRAPRTEGGPHAGAGERARRGADQLFPL